jgi:hypothetical protein
MLNKIEMALLIELFGIQNSISSCINSEEQIREMLMMEKVCFGYVNVEQVGVCRCGNKHDTYSTVKEEEAHKVSPEKDDSCSSECYYALYPEMVKADREEHEKDNGNYNVYDVYKESELI